MSKFGNDVNRIVREITIHIMAKDYEETKGTPTNLMHAIEFGLNQKNRMCIKMERMDMTLEDWVKQQKGKPLEEWKIMYYFT